MRLRNRMVKATFWTDPELCRWDRDKRHFYQSLWACAEDSCCIEDDMFGVKLAAWPSPLDADMTVERFDTWRDELVQSGKAIQYVSEGVACLYLRHMAEHEQPRNPQRPDCPLPPWVKWLPNDSDQRKGKYEHQSVSFDGCTTVDGEDSTVPAPPCPAPPCPEPSRAGNDGRSLAALPPCFAQDVQTTDGTKTISGWLLSTLEDRYSLMAPADVGFLGSAIKSTCPQFCPADAETAGDCASDMVCRIRDDERLSSNFRKDKRLLKFIADDRRTP